MEEYKYTFYKNNCWYSSVCKLFNTDECCSTCIRYLKMHYLANTSLLTYKQQRPISLYCVPDDFAAFTRLKQIKDNILEYVRNGNSLFLYSSNTGNGKTTWMCKLMMSYFNEIYAYTEFVPKGLFINTSMFLQGLKGEMSEYSRYIKEHIYDVDLVVWDDIFTKPYTAFEEEQLFFIIDARINSGKSNFYTTNKPPENNMQEISQRLLSRIYKNSERIYFNSEDLRGVNIG